MCKKEFEWSSSDVKCATFDVMSRKTMVWDACAMRCVACAMSEIAFELQHEEQSCHDVDDGDVMMVTIMSRTVTWMHLSGL